MLQVVYGGIKGGNRWWQVQDDYPRKDEPVKIGAIFEPDFQFFTVADVRLGIEDLNRVGGFCDELQRRFAREFTEHREAQNLIEVGIRRGRELSPKADKLSEKRKAKAKPSRT
jgi:hypothetical protein